MKIKMGTLRSLFTEGTISRILNEEDDSASHELGTSGSSIDSQVDRYLAQYEGDAKKADGESVDTMESIDWRDLVKGTVITEAGENEKDDESDPADQAPGADEMTGQDNGKLTIDKLDVEKFANDVVRLIENYDSLLEIRSTLIRRASEFLKKTYDDEVLKAFENTLRDDHGVEAGRDQGEVDADRYRAPNGDRSEGSAAPGGGATA